MKPTEKQLADDLRALRPLPAPAFATELDERAANRFPRGLEGSAASRRVSDRLGSLLRWRFAPALGAAIVIVAVAVPVAINSIGSDGVVDNQPPDSVQLDSSRPSGSGAAEEIAPVAPTTVPPSPPIGDDLKQDLKPNIAKREVERSASMTLSTEASNVPNVADGIVEVTDRYGGFVVSSDVHAAGDSTAGADFDLRIPTARLQSSLADLSGLAHVSARNEGSLDITAPLVSARERVTDARAEVDGLLEQLAAAGTPSETAVLRERLRQARAELAAARADRDSLTQRADFSAVSVTVRGDGGGGGWSLGDAADDAVSVLRTTAGVAIVSLAVLAPLALLFGGLALGTRVYRRRQREKALD